MRFDWRTLYCPAMIASYLSILIVVTGWVPPRVISTPFVLLGNVTVPAALLIIGSSLANLPVRDLIGGPRLWTCSVFRLLVMPAIIWAVFHAFVPAGLMFSVAVVLAVMAVATNGTMLCYQYGGNSRVLAQGTFVTTVLAIASIPLLAGFVGVVM